MNRRRFIGKKSLMVKIENSGSYTFVEGYKYVDMLLVGGGGPGGDNCGGGGGSGTIVYVKNFMLDKLTYSKTVRLTIGYSNTSQANWGGNTMLTIDVGNKQTRSVGAFGGARGGINSGVGGTGNNSNIYWDIYSSNLAPYVSNVNTDIAMASCGGGGAGVYDGKYFSGGSGATFSNSGRNGILDTVGVPVENGDGIGGFNGGYGSNSVGASGNAGGSSYRSTNVIIPIRFFGGGGYSGQGGSGMAGGPGGGAAGFLSGGNAATVSGGNGSPGGIGAGGGGGGINGKGGNGGSGVIFFYYHN